MTTDVQCGQCHGQEPKDAYGWYRFRVGVYRGRTIGFPLLTVACSENCLRELMAKHQADTLGLAFRSLT